MSDTSKIYLRSNPDYPGLLNTYLSVFSYNGSNYRTAEHLFQALKFTDQKHVEDIQLSDNPLTRAHQLEPAPNLDAKVQRRADWYKVNKIMLKIALYHKFTQHDGLKALLLSTESHELVNNVADRYWGIGQDRTGRNEFGVVLMEVRTELRKTSEVPPIPPLPTLEPPINFYTKGQPYYVFANFARAPVFYDGKEWKTSEHLFQAWKFTDEAHIRTIYELDTPLLAFHMGKDTKGPPIRKDWEEIKIDVMTFILYEKFNGTLSKQKIVEGDPLKLSPYDALVMTEGKEIIENSPRDDYWGIGKDGKGKNQLGKALVRVRDMIIYGFTAPTEPINPPKFTSKLEGKRRANAVAGPSTG